MLLKVYKSCIRPILEYGAIFFADCPEWISVQLDRIQWQCIRICIGATKTTHTQSLEVLSGIEPLQIRREIAAENFVRKRFSLRKWHEKRCTGMARDDTSSAISRGIIRMRNALTDDGRLLDRLPCYVYEREVKHYVPKIDLSIHSKPGNANMS